MMATDAVWLVKGLETLAERASPLVTMLDALPVGVVIAGAPEHRLLYMNREALRILGPAQGDMQGLALEAFFTRLPFQHLDGRICAYERRPLQCALDGIHVRNEMFLITAGDTPRVLVVSASPLQDVSGARVGAIAVWQDASAARATAEMAGAAARTRAAAATLAELPAEPTGVRLECAVSTDGPLTILTARGEVDLSNVQVFRGHVARALQQASAGSMRFDLRGITYLDGRGLRVLEEALQKNSNIEIAASLLVRRLLTLIGLPHRLA